MTPVTIEEFIDLPYRVEVVAERLSNGEWVYVASHPELDGCMTHGESPKEAIASLRDARELYLQALARRGLPIPRPAPRPEGMMEVQARCLVVVAHGAGFQPAPAKPVLRQRLPIGEAVAHP